MIAPVPMRLSWADNAQTTIKNPPLATPYQGHTCAHKTCIFENTVLSTITKRTNGPTLGYAVMNLQFAARARRAQCAQPSTYSCCSMAARQTIRRHLPYELELECSPHICHTSDDDDDDARRLISVVHGCSVNAPVGSLTSCSRRIACTSV